MGIITSRLEYSKLAVTGANWAGVSLVNVGGAAWGLVWADDRTVKSSAASNSARRIEWRRRTIRIIGIPQ
jgi:hypothetical protein